MRYPFIPVSYTHLDVYKRQDISCSFYIFCENSSLTFVTFFQKSLWDLGPVFLVGTACFSDFFKHILQLHVLFLLLTFHLIDKFYIDHSIYKIGMMQNFILIIHIRLNAFNNHFPKGAAHF